MTPVSQRLPTGTLLGPFRVSSSIEGLPPFLPFYRGSSFCAPLYARLLKMLWFDLRPRAHGIYTTRPHTSIYASSFVRLLVRERVFPADETYVSHSYVSNFTAAITYDRDDKRVMTFQE